MRRTDGRATIRQAPRSGCSRRGRPPSSAASSSPHAGRAHAPRTCNDQQPAHIAALLPHLVGQLRDQPTYLRWSAASGCEVTASLTTSFRREGWAVTWAMNRAYQLGLPWAARCSVIGCTRHATQPRRSGESLAFASRSARRRSIDSECRRDDGHYKVFLGAEVVSDREVVRLPCGLAHPAVGDRLYPVLANEQPLRRDEDELTRIAAAVWFVGVHRDLSNPLGVSCRRQSSSLTSGLTGRPG